ncbi:Molybdopterin synthase catalytic subunit [Camellia lanceoleosa]|uniref:Molybdopterin synthase catalytic subunit n=1 Tax=Camellia lanceoleosa TaxID=1840588 RepID=A0ACC0FLD0_9ERIC|nr:Molybdopterin synthase catalytic subunit [Camellia lanceoleosa]
MNSSALYGTLEKRDSKKAQICTKSICSSARSFWNLHSIVVAHRLGPVPINHTNVFIAVSAVHCAEALDACKFLIDEIKASVLIWKKEVYVNGQVWKENSEFLERRIQIVEGNGVCSEKKKGCCAVKVNVESGTSDSCDN